MHARSLRTSLLVALAFAAFGCSSVDCDDPTRYIGAELKTPVQAPAGLDAPEARDTYRVPGGAPPADYAGGACLMKPPQLIAPPKPDAQAAPVEPPKPAEPPAQG